MALWWAFALIITHCACVLAFNREASRKQHARKESWLKGRANENDQNPNTILLPIFPLRKTARFPTDPLTLNLYEDRYLAMAEDILQHKWTSSSSSSNSKLMRFGALYTSDKAQVVGEGGMGPIVPLLQEGDVGTLFDVYQHEEGLIPTQGGQERRRRIRLEATGEGRFQIQRLIHNGYSSETNYMVAEVVPYRDDTVGEHSNALEQRVQDLSQQCVQRQLDAISRGKSSQFPSPQQQLLQELLAVGRVGTQALDVESRSWALASYALDKRAARERAAVLQDRSLSQRLDLVEQFLKQPSQNLLGKLFPMWS